MKAHRGHTVEPPRRQGRQEIHYQISYVTFLASLASWRFNSPFLALLAVLAVQISLHEVPAAKQV